MKVQKYEIARVIDKLKSIVQKNDQFPALGGILVKDGYLIASNSEITMKVKLEASEGSYFIIPMKAFDLIKNLPDGEIDISATDKNVVMIKIGAIKNKYQSYPPEEFNFDITEDPEADGVELNGKKIMEAISHVIYAAADGGANTQMTGIYFEGTDSGVSLAALDGHVVAVDSVKAEGTKDMKLIVPKTTAKKLISMGVIDDVTLTYTKNSAVYRSWYFKRRIQEIEAIGIERDLAGLPVIHAPEDLEIWDSHDPDMVKINGALIAMVKNLRRNESEGLVLPHGYEAELLSTGGTRQFDTNAIINRYDTKIAQTVLADFIMLGHEKTGSFALSSDKTELFSVALGAFLDVICETFNNQGIPSLIDINGSHFDGIEDYPTLAHGDVDKRDITKLSTFLKDMVGTGILIPDEELEDYVREAANLPERTEVPDSREKDERREAQRRAPEKTANEPDEPEVDPEENQDAEEAKKRLGR